MDGGVTAPTFRANLPHGDRYRALQDIPTQKGAWPQRVTVLGQQPIHAALHQSITHQQQHVIESALPIVTPRHTPILRYTQPTRFRHAETALLNQRRPGWSTGPAAGRVAAARRLLAVLTDA
jgi:hypothetical protein